MTIFQSPIGKSENLLPWTHYYILTQELNPEARVWYEKESAAQDWSTRTLQRNVSSQYYYRVFTSKYMLYMPTPEQLRAEIERQKAIYYLKAKDARED